MNCHGLRHLPADVAGIPIVAFKPEEKRWTPFVRDGQIHLPEGKRNEFVLLNNPDLFLFRCRRPSGESLKLTFLAGLDESPFVTQVRQYPEGINEWVNPYHVFKTLGEEAMFDSFVPRLIRCLRDHHGASCGRQGDIHFAKIKDWRSYVAAWRLTHGSDLRLERVENRSVLYTRHLLTGRSTGNIMWEADERLVFARGVLTAPDHQPRKLKGMHLIMQSPVTAD